MTFPHSGSSIDERWKNLRNALAGLFCASLGSLDDQRTTSPTLTFQPEGDLPETSSAYQLRHATLPSEHVCTENLTPFLKLLPCKSLSGIATLLNPHRLFDADWHGMGVHVRFLEGTGIEVRLAFQAVLNPVRYAGDKKRGTITVGCGSCDRLKSRADWSLHSLFDRSIDRACPVASSSEVLVESSAASSAITEPEPSAKLAGMLAYDVHRGKCVLLRLNFEFDICRIVSKPLNVAMRWEDENQFEYRKRESVSQIPTPADVQ